MMLSYHVDVAPDDNDTFLVTCPAIPMVATFGETREAALHNAVDAIETALDSMISDNEDIPPPDQSGQLVKMSLLTTLKVSLYQALRSAGVNRAELARRLSWNRESVDRLFRLDHASRLNQIEAAFKALGKEVTIDVKIAA
ncbi:type II toxin-antitoxin system HicB family antitoxin [Methylocapsa sp. S129]|uniref:type II toxin-antitoxin system HicB family antitoxin n=1 Tax=Methylocapsa sp. S129 TaxID=1641869 RepID=UPI001FEE9852|nr:type II toxin-antitoxin system HicB family antitoxin [Methylocapsa sp. S129]